MERRVPNAFPGAPPPVPYYQNNYNNPHHHQTHPPPQHHHVAAIGFHQYPQNDNRDQRFNQPHYSGQQQNMIVDQSNNAPPPFPPSPCGGGSLRKRRSQSATDTADGSIAKLYVAPISKTSTEYDIRQVFETYGNVTEIILPKDKMTGDRAAYCFVKYKTVEEGNAAIAALAEQFTFPGEMLPLKVRFADAERERIGKSFAPVQPPDNPKLYIRCLNKQTTKMEVHEVFSRFGIIEDIYMALDDMKISRGYAFVQFSCREMALAAIKGLNGVFTMRGSDQPLIVRFADPKKPRSTFNTPPAMQHFDPNWHSQPYPQWENKEPAAPRVVQHHDFSSQPNHFPHQNTQAVSEVHQPLHQDIPPQNLEKHQNSETASVETRRDGQKISSHSNSFPEEQNTVSSECDWSEHTCPDGNKYYFHCVTCESTWEKPEEYSMFERWFEEQTRLQDLKLVSPPLNNESQKAIENSEQVKSDLLQQNAKLQQPSLSTADQENNVVYRVTTLAVETTCS
ncbi:flowering time control protein FCA isoform X1 [Arabidopsis lyrata subsp. lyrata]|uniref:flowering time control protein FCA isoform X1 n=1 Tax=Arabidopsis lyrata subsp. lyrata TaxID=81972 RepID=UPI000A29A300|nr:flowering time control protein FCA isoform X1 [Arabidopsis lyrata subsp. lyrata]|eukprot:XP_020885515.1 flowering time control protein FCA isoform X1 [Arabidopsis lyrata subsp. lyrata]